MVNPTGIVGAAGVTSMLFSVAPVTCSGVEPVTPPNVAEMSVVPAAMPVATVPLSGAMLGFDDAQVACVVRSWVVLSV